MPERIDTESVIGQRFGDGRLYRFFNQSGASRGCSSAVEAPISAMKLVLKRV
ncbi:MAG: hypothetical protein ACLUFM_02500 [Lachnospiraceae bacterium]